MKQSYVAGKWWFSLTSVVFVLFFSMTVFGQKGPLKTITGRVTSISNDSAVAYASISVKGTTSTVAAGPSGEFSIQAHPGDVLVISFVGYQSREVKLGANDKNLTIALSLNQAPLSEVVVVGYGKMKKADMSSAVLTVSSAELQRTVNTTLDQALQGKAPNVYVSQSSGAPGAGASVIIRGVSTVTGNSQPLYVIDGVQIRPSMSRGGAYQTGSGGASNELAGLNPEDIESMSVLMGPAATSIYGAAGANGVLVITTKQGKSGATRVNVTSAQTLQTRPGELPTMNLREWAEYRLKMQQYGLVGYNPPEIMDPTLLGEGTNWQRELFKNTLMQKYSLSVSGGSEKSTFYISGDYLSQKGVAVGSGFNRGSVRMNLINTVNPWLKFNTNLNSFVTKEKVNTYQANIINMALQQNPSIPVKTPNGGFGGPATPQEAQYAITNPIAIAQLNNNYNTSFGVIGGLSMDVTPFKGLVWHTEGNGNYTFNNNYTFNPSYSLGRYYTNPNTTGSRGSSNNYWVSLNTRLQYDYTVGKHYVSAMVGHEAQYYAYQSLSASGTRYSTNSIQELSVADPLSPPGSSDRGNGSNESYFSRLNYTFDNKYIAQVVYRRDGSSNFGPANRFGNFPAASLAWKISDEKFMQGFTFINDLKLRGEYGISGNSGQGGAIYSRLYPTATVWGGGFLPSNFPNPNLKWEQDKSANIGLDLHMFNNRIEIIADAYKKNISNLILPATGPQYLGGYLQGGFGGQVAWPIVNYGAMHNKGFGINLNTVNLSTKNFQWKTGVNFSMDRNKVDKLVSPIITAYRSWGNDIQSQFLITEGQPLSMITGYVAEGLFQDNKDIATHAIQTGGPGSPLIIDPVRGSWVGDIKYKDQNGDGYIDQKDRIVIGNPWPKFTYNFNSSFQYKAFNLNLFFTGVSGNTLLNLVRYQNETLPQGGGVYGNHFRSDANFAVPSSTNPADAAIAVLTNPGHNIPNLFVDANGNNRISQWNVEDGSYIKLKNVRLTYRVPNKLLSRTHALRGVLATFQVQNAFTITKYSGYDPEIGMYNYSGINLVGLDEGRYPSTRSYTFSLSIDL